MELRAAIARAAKVLPKKKDSPFKHIRFIPGDGKDLSARVFATDGVRMSVVDVDGELPNVMLESDQVVKAAKDSKQLEVVEVGLGNIELRTDMTTYKGTGINFDDYPVLPPIPDEFDFWKNWVQITRVFHAAAKDDEPDLAVIHFTPQYVEALDKARLARWEVPGNWEGLVSANLFKSWPKGSVGVKFTKEYAFFKLAADELRIGLLQHGKYPDTKNVLPKIPRNSALVDIGEIKNAVSQGTSISRLGLIKLEFGDEGLAVRAWQEGKVGESFEALVPTVHKWYENTGSVLVNGKYVEQALKATVTPNVVLSFGDIVDPLRIDSGAFTACIWQLGL